MAFSRTPTSDTYSQVDIDITREWISRQGDASGLKDEQFLNCFPETVKNTNLGDKRQMVFKRAGCSVYYDPPVTGTIRGLYYWTDYKRILFAVSDDLYMYNTSTGVLTTFSNIFGTTSGTVGMCSYLYDNGTVIVIATDGTTLVRINQDGTSVTCSDPDLPTPHIPTPIFLDGYLFLAKTDTGNLYNSDLNDPMAWTGDYITAEMDGDRIVNLAKVNNYIVAFGSDTIEWFWDAGVETGSPLQRNATPIKNIKVLSGVTTIGNSVYFIGAEVGRQMDVYVINDFIATPVGSPTITRYLNTMTAGFATYKGFPVSFLGHTFYMVIVGDYTWAYDVETKQWIRMAFQDNTDFNVSNSVILQTNTVLTTMFTVGTANVFYKFDDTVYQDNGTNFTMRVVTEPGDFGTLNRKSMHKFAIVCDRPSASSSAYVSWSDDDYQTFSTPVAVNLDQDLPSITRLGNFRQRAFKFEYTDNYPMRIQQFQANINKGRS